MNIASTQYTLENKAFEIYLSGCSGNPRCNGCHNPELWDFSIGENYIHILKDILKKVKEFDSMIDNIWVLGGEPLDNNLNNLSDLLLALKTTNKKIWLFTRHEINEVPLNIKHLCDYIKTGRFDIDALAENNVYYGVKLASKNQKIHKIKR